MADEAKSGGIHRLPTIGLLLGLVPVLIYLGMTLAYRLDLISFSVIFRSWPWLIPVLMGAVVLMAVAAVWFIFTRRVGSGLVAIMGALAAAAMIMGPTQMRAQGAQVPPIHDISTDVENPPAFVVTAAQRTPDDNPPAYDAGQTAQQLEAYPDLQSIEVSASPDQAFGACVAAAEAIGLKIVDESPEEGRLEGTATSRWFGFKDDVVFRLRPTDDGGTVIDIRSKSRTGRSDLGVNAARIRQLREEIEAALE